MSVPQHTSPVLGLGAFGLLVGGLILVMALVEARQDRPGDGRCAELWNAPANQSNRSLVRGRAFALATVRGVEPNKAGQPGCVVLLRELQGSQRSRSRQFGGAYGHPSARIAAAGRQPPLRPFMSRNCAGCTRTGIRW